MKTIIEYKSGELIEHEGHYPVISDDVDGDNESDSEHVVYICKEGTDEMQEDHDAGLLKQITIVFALLLAIVGASGCAAAHRPPPVVQQQANVNVSSEGIERFGINDGFHGPIPDDIIDHYCQYPRRLTVRAPVLNVEQAQALVTSIARCSLLSADLLIETDDRALASALGEFAKRWPDFVDAIECGNELDISGSQLDAEHFATWVYDCNKALRDAGFVRTVVSGGVYALNDNTWQYLQPTIKVCATIGCAIGIHDYDNVENVWMDRLAALGVPVWITETGAHSVNAEQDAGQAAFLRAACAGFARAHVKRVIVYQRPSAGDASDLANFGIQYFPQARGWKPADAALQQMMLGSC